MKKTLFFLLSPHNCLPGVARMSERYKSRTQEVLTMRGPEGDQKGEEEQEKTDKLRTMIEILQEKLAKVYTSTFTYVCLRLFLESPFRTVLNVFFFSTKRQNSSSNSSAKPTEGSTWSQRTGNISKPPTPTRTTEHSSLILNPSLQCVQQTIHQNFFSEGR